MLFHTNCIVPVIQNTQKEGPSDAPQSLELSVIGLDRPGIVKELARAFAAHQLNISHLSSRTESAAMSGEELFKAEVTLDLHANFDSDKFNQELEDICNELDLDVITKG